MDNEFRIFFVDGFKIAREEATDAELQLRMQGNAFQGAFFAASPLMEMAGLDEKKLFAAIEEQLDAKFGSKGKRVVDDNLRVVHRGFDEIHEITHKQVGVSAQQAIKEESLIPVMLKQLPHADGGISDVHRFWEQTGSFYATGKGSDNLADPFQALSLIPASTGVFRDMTQIRFEYPKWVAENCTACGDCYRGVPGLRNPRPGELDQRGVQHRHQPDRDRRPTHPAPAPRDPQGGKAPARTAQRSRRECARFARCSTRRCSRPWPPPS